PLLFRRPAPSSCLLRPPPPPRRPSFPTRRSSDLHALIDRFLGADEELAALFEVPQSIGHRDAVLHRDQHTLATALDRALMRGPADRKSTRLNSSHVKISYAVFCLKKKNTLTDTSG